MRSLDIRTLIQEFIRPEVDDTPKKSAEKEIERQDRILRQKAATGRAAMELESFEPFRQIFDPYVEKIIKDGFEALLIEGLEMDNNQKNIIIARMAHAMSIYALLKTARKEGKDANREVEKRDNIKKARADEEARIAKREKSRSEAVAAKTAEYNRKRRKPAARGEDTPVT